MRSSGLVVLYAAFAMIATAANLGTQWVVLQTWKGGESVYPALLLGTAVGVPVKYVLDKRYIFRYRTASVGEEGRLFTLYLAMAVLTTLLFWCTELAFHVLVGSDAARLSGGALGLLAGYLLKYQLDRRFVFVSRPANVPVR